MPPAAYLSDAPYELLISVSAIAGTINDLVQHASRPALSPAVMQSSLQAASDPTITTLVIQLPQPLTSHLASLGLQLRIANALSRSYVQAAARLRTSLQNSCRRAFQSCVDATLQQGFTLPPHLFQLRLFYEAHFAETVHLWAQSGLAMTRDRLMNATLKVPLRLGPNSKVNPHTLMGYR